MTETASARRDGITGGAPTTGALNFPPNSVRDVTVHVTRMGKGKITAAFRLPYTPPAITYEGALCPVNEEAA